MNRNFKNISFENLSKEEKLVLSLKESLNRYKCTKGEEQAFYGALIGAIAHDLKLLGIYDKCFK